jgi:hypothetical protein
MINQQLFWYETVAGEIHETATRDLFKKWLALNPYPPDDLVHFWQDLYRVKALKMSVQFINGKDYLLNEAGDDFVEKFGTAFEHGPKEIEPEIEQVLKENEEQVGLKKIRFGMGQPRKEREQHAEKE